MGCFQVEHIREENVDFEMVENGYIRILEMNGKKIQNIVELNIFDWDLQQVMNRIKKVTEAKKFQKNKDQLEDLLMESFEFFYH
ncbi:MAG: hypothetical protein EBV86_01305 [Marivivens sp.]|nr:hypothetical protein [Marivivens sp.]NBT49973.1 hypothetical protein [Marivivens sp.]NCW67193.1 hypothetical protein [Marivivens sp.]